MRILLVNDYSTRTGGAQMYVLRLREALRQHGHVCALASSNWGEKDQREADYEYPAVRWKCKVLQRTAQLRHSQAIRRFRDIVTDFGPDVVHLHMFHWHLSLGVLPLLADIPTVFTAHTPRMACPIAQRFIRAEGRICDVQPGWECYRRRCIPMAGVIWEWQRQRLLRKYRANIDLLIAPSRWLQRELQAVGFPRVMHLFYGIELPEPAAHRSNGHVLFAGRLVPEKRPDLILKAASIIADQVEGTRFLIAGDGPLRVTLQDEIRERGLGGMVELLGWLGSDELAALHQDAAALVVPSQWGENSPVSIYESLALGTPVVASDIAGIPDLVQNGITGLLFRPGDATDLAAKLWHLLERPGLAQRMGKHARAFAEAHLSMESHIRALENAYETVLADYG